MLDVGRWLAVIADMPSVKHNLFYPYVEYHNQPSSESTSFKKSTQLGKTVPYD